jgi:sugar lactone lactonase YvrE
MIRREFLMNRRLVAVAAVLGLATALGPAAAASATSTTATATVAGHNVLPTQIDLPDGFQPEGIAIGALPFAFFGSRADGDIYRANLITGEGRVITQGPGTGSLGMKLDLRGRLFVAGGPGGDARVVNGITGQVLASYTFAAAPTFINDVVLTGDAAWFTDSMNANLYKVPLGRHGSLPGQSAVVRVPLSGDYVQVPGFNANGITETPDGKALLVVQSATGLLFRVNKATGVATTVDLGGTLLSNGDGLLLLGRTLYAVQNVQNLVAVVQLNRAGTSGELVNTLTSPDFDVPTTAAAFGNRLYLPNARFTTPPTDTTPYTAVAIRKP